MFEEEFAICATRLRCAEIRCQCFGASVFCMRSNTIPPAWGIQNARINVSGAAPPAPTSPPGSGVVIVVVTHRLTLQTAFLSVPTSWVSECAG